MAALLFAIKKEDAAIMASLIFVSAANAFALQGAQITFVDIRPEDMNINPEVIEAAIGPRTKAIVVMHYGGVGCEMDKIKAIADRHQLWIVEDAAHCLDSYYKGKHLGSIGHLGTLSFHYTKNIHCGEGGALLINDERLLARAEIIRDKGTNRQQFLRSEVTKYHWVELGSSYVLGELNAAFLYPQFQQLQKVTQHRLRLWQAYHNQLSATPLELPQIAPHCQHNAHIFYIKCKDQEERRALIQFLKQEGISTAFHYIPLHSAPAGLAHGHFAGTDRYTTEESNRLLRLPLHHQLESVTPICEAIHQFYG